MKLESFVTLISMIGSAMAPLPSPGVNLWIEDADNGVAFMAVDLHTDNPPPPGNPCMFASFQTSNGETCNVYPISGEARPKLVWDEAREYAKSINYLGFPAHLATPKSQELDDFIRENVMEGTNEAFMGGAYQKYPASDFTWIPESGGGVIGSSTYENWGSNEPNGGTNEDCLEIKGPENGDGYTWNDINCDERPTRFILIQSYDSIESYVEGVLGIPCDGQWKNHGQYVSKVAKALTTLVKQGSITAEQKNMLNSAVGESDCGK
jgi:hypothetical protein